MSCSMCVGLSNAGYDLLTYGFVKFKKEPLKSIGCVTLGTVAVAVAAIGISTLFQSQVAINNNNNEANINRHINYEHLLLHTQMAKMSRIRNAGQA